MLLFHRLLLLSDLRVLSISALKLVLPSPLEILFGRILRAIIGRRRRERHQKSQAGKPWWRKMGNESSVPVEDDVPPATLRERTLEAAADYIKEKNVRRIVVMVRYPSAVGLP